MVMTKAYADFPSICYSDPIDDDYVRSLGTDALRDLSLRLLTDLKELRERLNQGPANSSRPPSSRSPWERGQFSDPTHEPEAPPAGDSYGICREPNRAMYQFMA